jgi:hypothetical protein
MHSRFPAGIAFCAAACLVLAIGAGPIGGPEGVDAQAKAPQYHASAVRGQRIELEVQLPEDVRHAGLEIDGMLEKLFDYEPPFNFLIETASLDRGKHEWHARSYQEGCCIYGSESGSIRIYALPKVRAPVVSALAAPGERRVMGLVVSKVARNLAVRAWASRARSSSGVHPLPLRLVHRHRARRVYEFAHGLTMDVGRRAKLYVEVAPAKRTVQHGVEVRGRLAQFRLLRDRRIGATRALQSAVTACTIARSRRAGSAQPLPKRQSCTLAPPAPAVSIVCLDDVVGCEPGPRQRQANRG